MLKTQDTLTKHDALSHYAVDTIHKWMEKAYRPIQTDYVCFDSYNKNEHASRRIVFMIYTSIYEYAIHIAIKPTQGSLKEQLSKCYMGAYLGGRKPLPGCTMTGGSDLPDGKCSNKLWNQILTRIVAIESLKVESNDWKDKHLIKSTHHLNEDYTIKEVDLFKKENI